MRSGDTRDQDGDPSPLDALVRAVRERRPRSPMDAPLLVLLPDALHVHEIQQRLLDAGCAGAGVHLLSAHACTRQLAGAESEGDEISHGNLESWLSREIREQLQNLIPDDTRREFRYLARHASARRRLLSTLLTLRRIEAAYDVTFRGRSPRSKLFLSLLPQLASVIEASGCDDAAARIARMRSSVASQAHAWPRETRVIVYAPQRREAPELAALVRALGAHGAELEFVAAPFCASPPGGATGGAESARPRAELQLRDGHARPTLETFSAQGVEAEVLEALRRARERMRCGVRADRIALVAARPHKYAGMLASCARRESVPIAQMPAGGRAFAPPVQLATSVLRLLADAPRARFTTTMRHPLLDLGSDEARVLAALHAFDRDSREGGAARGLDNARSFAGEREDDPVRRFLDALAALRDELTAARRHAELAASLGAAFEAWIRLDPDDASHARGQAQIERALDQLALRDALALALPTLEELPAIFDALLPEPGRDREQREGIAWLALGEHGGRDFDDVFLLGMERGAFPPPQQDHPHLGLDDLEELRDKVRAAREKHPALHPDWRSPLPALPSEDARLAVEDLQAWIGQCSGRLTVSHCRADELGKPHTPSPWIGAIAAALGRPRRTDELFADPATHASVAWEPKRRAAERMESSPSASDALIHAGLHGGAPVLADVAHKLASPLERSLARAASWLEAVDSFELRARRALRHDPVELGRSNVLEKGISVSDFDTLASCPLQFYFKTILRARPLPQEPSYDATSSLEVGNAAHKVCELVYARVFEGDDELEARIARARALVEREVGRQDRYFTAPLERELNKLGDHVLAAWRGALADFVEADLRKLDERGLRPQKIEEKIEAEIRVGPEDAPIHVAVRGKIDRFDAPIDGADSERRPRVVDYKTGKSVRPDVDLAAHVRSLRHTQLPIYSLMVEQQSGVLPDASLLGIAPHHRKSFGASYPELGVDRSIWLQREKLLRSLGERVQAVVDGSYVFRENTPFPCNYCDYRSACPRHHPPTKERLRRYGGER